MPAHRPHRLPARPWAALAWLWLATLLFVGQVALHAATPAGQTMAAVLAAALRPAVQEPPAQAMSGMDMNGTGMDGTDTTAPHPAPHRNITRAADRANPAVPCPDGHAGHMEGLCCMPPMALVPRFWTPPPLPLGRRAVPLARAVAEALRVLRATARGPPTPRTAAPAAA
ncbi:hypothetical protein [Deinococcus aquiradiocola]|uniref:Uncharacterized protein n=1 Tax=Deinococcus aquiradiocola TaxID=393059 RepID=A0A917PMT6_9DEIO|nr:hypothetical protein [Deinococcus aquiradiocola]GGJ85378.1 hypothetical protein GCM10008939_31590 [Deinococcus aquiradiocola]